MFPNESVSHTSMGEGENLRVGLIIRQDGLPTRNLP